MIKEQMILFNRKACIKYTGLIYWYEKRCLSLINLKVHFYPKIRFTSLSFSVFSIPAASLNLLLKIMDAMMYGLKPASL
jgi:hypothetical protein